MVVLKNGTQIPMSRNEYIAYHIALDQADPSKSLKSYENYQEEVRSPDLIKSKVSFGPSNSKEARFVKPDPPTAIAD